MASNYHRQVIDSKEAVQKRIAYCQRELDTCREGSPNRALWVDRLKAAKAELKRMERIDAKRAFRPT